MEFRVLGPVEVDGPDGPLTVGGRRQRLVLAHMLLRANQLVATEVLIDEIWDQEPPDGARNAIQAYISRLRHVVGDRIEGRDAGYLLRVEPGELDLERFEELVRDGRALVDADPADAAATLKEALGIWRGPAFADLADERSLAGEIVRLTELRSLATEERISAELAMGRHKELISELESLTAADPLRERLWGMLMLALYRSGRQADALAAYARARDVLSEQLGIDPSRGLQRLHERVLSQDPALSMASARAPVANTDPSSSGDLAPGTRIGGYKILEVLGRGGMSVVYLAEHEGLRRKVALKLLAPQLSADERFQERFVRESQLAASLDHPNVIPIYEAGEADGYLFIAMRYVDGTDLRKPIRATGALSTERTLAILRQVAAALDAAHRRGLVHRDVKPGNVLVARMETLEGSEQVYLSDFGLTKRASSLSGVTGTGQFIGTLDYAAPEQFQGRRLDARTDVYSLGAMLFECLTGHPPFRRENDASLMHAHLTETPPAVTDERAELPGAIDTVIARAMAKDPTDRYQTAGELAADAADALKRETAGVLLRTFMIADVRGYTTFTQEQGDERAAELASRFAEIVRQVVAGHGGVLLELRGDEALTVFVSARQAIRAAVQLQAAVRDADLPRGVGIGVDAGEAVAAEGGYRGGALNLAARLCAKAAAGEVLASEAVTHLAARVDGIAYTDLRSFNLKGFDEPVRAVRVVPEDQLARGSGAAGEGLAPADPQTGPCGRRGGRRARPGRARTAADPGRFVRGVDHFPTRDRDHRPGNPRTGRTCPCSGSGRRLLRRRIVLVPQPRTALLRSDRRDHVPDRPHHLLARYAGAVVRRRRRVPLGDGRLEPGARSYGYPDRQGGGPVQLLRSRGRGIVRTRSRCGVDLDGRGPQPLAYRSGERSRAGEDRAQVHRIHAGNGPDGRLLDRRQPLVQRRIPVGSERRQTQPDRPCDERPSAFKAGVPTPVKFAVGGEGFGWATSEAGNSVYQVSPRGYKIGSFETGQGPESVAFDEGKLWVANYDSASVGWVDVTNGNTGSITVGHPVQGIAAGAGLVAFTVGRGVGVVDRIAAIPGDVLRLTFPTEFNHVYDPALAVEDGMFQVERATCVKLLNAPVAAAPEGWALQPEVAESMPDVSADGRTYTFRIRDGFRFSPPSEEPVTAETFRYSIERALSPNLGTGTPGPRLIDDIEGVEDFRAGRSEHISGLVTAGDTLTITLTEPSGDFLQRLAAPYFCPVPTDTPILAGGVEGDIVASAGPYYATENSPGELLLLEANPNYGGNRQPGVDAIAIRTGLDEGDALYQVGQGDSDGSVGSLGSLFFGAIRDEPGFRTTSLPGVTVVVLNATGQVFSDPGVRAAFATAFDRFVAAWLWGMLPTDELVPPDLAGGEQDPSATLPDREAARELMPDSAGVVRIAVTACQHCQSIAIGSTGDAGLVNTLRRLGLGSSVELVSRREILAHPDRYDMVIWWNFLDYQDTASYVAAMFGDVAPATWYPSDLRSEADRVLGLEGEARTADAVALAERLTAEHIVIPYALLGRSELLADRVGCRVYPPLGFGVDLASLCITEVSPSASASP